MTQELIAKIKAIHYYSKSALLQSIVDSLESGDIAEAQKLVSSHSDKLRDKELRFIAEAFNK